MKTIFSIALFLLVFQMQGQKKKTKSMINTKYLIGTWELVQAANGDGISISQTWEFNGVDVKMYGYPQIQQKGRYTVKKDSADILILHLYGQEGDWRPADKELKLQIDRTKGIMTMGGSMEFKKKQD
ncbi:MAG: hypothetical protein K0S33_1662 [Bacteroidetes bacterium]|jgi:hypothetical protein|nr:hypothetical protein [Bacteroidota bacterium]